MTDEPEILGDLEQDRQRVPNHPSWGDRLATSDYYENGSKPVRSTTGKVLDIYDGAPMFDTDDEGNPRSRRRYLDETKDERKAATRAELAAVIAELSPAAEDDGADVDPEER